MQIIKCTYDMMWRERERLFFRFFDVFSFVMPRSERKISDNLAFWSSILNQSFTFLIPLYIFKYDVHQFKSSKKFPLSNF